MMDMSDPGHVPPLMDEADADALVLADDVVAGHEEPVAVARLVEHVRGHHVAFAPHTTMEIMEEPRVVDIPGAPYYTHGLVAWQGQWLPLIRLESLIAAYNNTPKGDLPVPRYALILAYQTQPGAPVQYGALSLNGLIESVEVRDRDACPLPDDSDIWGDLAISCFQHKGLAIPILDPTLLFGAYLG